MHIHTHTNDLNALLIKSNHLKKKNLAVNFQLLIILR